MSGANPLKSVISIKTSDETSLALPSVNQYPSGEQRVRAQLQTIRRMKSRHSSTGRSGSTSTSLSPTSPVYDSVFLDGVKSQSNTSNGSVLYSNGFMKNSITDKTINDHRIYSNLKGSAVRKETLISGHNYKRGAVLSPPAMDYFYTSRSEPGLVLNNSVVRPSVPLQRKPTAEQWGNRNIYTTKHSTSSHLIKRAISQPHPLYYVNGSGLTPKLNLYRVSQPDMNKMHSQYAVVDSSSKSKINSRTNGNFTSADITMTDAVEFLSSDDEHYQNYGASFIQHNTFINDKAKEEVLKLNGISPLLGLLQSPNSQIKSTASAALRNLSFKNDKNKAEIQRCNGIPEVVAQLRGSNSVELDKQLTGLLWNLSSADNLKSDLLNNALPVLTERMILPYTTGSSDPVDPDVFCNATGCLRNLSSAKQSSRQTMRKCRGLIDGLATYIKHCVENDKTDESLENCLGTLHNLSFQLEEEFPSVFTNINALAKNLISSSNQNNANPIGCFSSPSKPPQVERHFDYAVIEDPQPKGAGLLIHSKTLKDYLSLVHLSEQESLQEICSGTLQNLTAHEGAVSCVISQIIVQKLNGMQYITPSLKSSKVNVQKNTLGLVVNLTKNPNLHSTIGRKALPVLLGLLTKGTAGANESDDTLSLACQATSNLILSDLELTKKYLTNNVIESLSSISQNMYFPKSKKAASVLLVKIWSDKDLQSFVKRLGKNKSLFINDTTMAAQKSFHVVD
ncbi:plakophilin-1-like [Anableps anableps]